MAPAGSCLLYTSILIRVNAGATRNNAVLLPAEQLLLEALFRKGDKVVLTGRRNRVLRRAFLRMQKFYLPRKKSSFYRPDTFLQWAEWRYWRSFSMVT